MIVLGISGGVRVGNQDAAAALMVDGRLVAAAEEERFIGVKFANGQLPRQAIGYCLRQANLAIGDVDRVLFPGATWPKFDAQLADWLDFQFGHAPPVDLVDHHTAHAASALYGSGWDDATVLTFDFSGDGQSTTLRRARGGVLEAPRQFAKPNSLGLFYSLITQYLGFQKDSDEYKVMGMAAVGRPNIDLSRLLRLTQDGYELESAWLRGVEASTPAPSKQERLFRQLPIDVPRRLPGGELQGVHFDLAASAQRHLEEAALHLLRRFGMENPARRLCLAGGVALNCRMNQRLRDEAGFDALYVPPVPSDAGLALGCAYLGCLAAGQTPSPIDHAYWGPAYSEREVREVLDRASVAYRRVECPAEAACERLVAGKFIGWFQGRMEFGPRALGNRSILADPRRADAQDQINRRIKFREEFRPIAPAVLHEQGAKWFDRYADSPYMTQTFDARESARQHAPAIVHTDGTARLQSVHAATNSLFAELIGRFASQTGVPILVNTSLNAWNDPLACAPHQALRTFATTGLDTLILGNLVVDKSK